MKKTISPLTRGAGDLLNPFFLLSLLMLSPAQAAFAAGDAASAAVNPDMNKRSPVSVEKTADPNPATVLVNGFIFSGNNSISSPELNGLLKEYVGKRCSLIDLRQAAGKVGAEYLRRGNPLAKAYIPPQRVNGGLVTVTIVEGRIGRVIVEGNKNYSTEFIRKNLTGGRETAKPTIDCIEKGLLRLNEDFVDLKVTANFAPGELPGTTDIHVKVDDGSPVHVTLSGNNFGSDYVSRYRYGATAEWTNALLPGAYMTLGGLIGDKPKDMNVYSGSYEFPINSCGTIVGMSAFNGNFDVGKDFSDLGIHNEETSVDLYLRQPLIRERGEKLFAKIGFRGAEAKYYLMDELSSRDNTRVAYLQLQGDRVFAGGRGLANLTVAKGLGGMFGGTENGSTYASRVDANNDFFKANLDLARFQPLSDDFSLLVRASGQWSPDNLLASEEWLIGGIDSVHGFSIGEGAGDRGYSASLSLRANPLSNKQSLQLAAFIDYGYSYKRTIFAGSQHRTDLTGVGFGISSHLMTVAPTDVRFDVGFPLNSSTNHINDKPVLYFQTSIRL
ncbi:MAG TPA: ShlB/FhaC/HecB family hemolysin secretion/activation protein [Chlorobaculum sp.]|nr:ShlB/FhaC/HecB family hemolysin secretion/activation protein [Chlorobaculum sp.]